MKGIKNELSLSLKNNKYYNPNTFNAVDGLLAFLTVLVVMFALGKLLSYPVEYIVANKFITDYFLLEIILGVITQLVILAVALVFFKIKKVGLFSGEGYNFKLNAIDSLMSVMLTMGIGLCFYSLHLNFFDDMTGIFGDLGLTIPESVISKSNPLFIMLYNFILVPIFPAIIEELLFRGVVMRGMAEKGMAFSIIGSSLLFAMMHGSVGMLILQFILGVAIAIVVTLTKNHLYGVIMHFSNNLFLSILLALPEIAGETAPYFKFVVSAFLTLFGIVFLLVSAYYFFKKYTAKYKAEILGIKKQKTRFENRQTVCYSFVCRCEYEYYLSDYDELDNNVIKNSDALFLYKDKFCKFNRKSNDKLAYLLFAVALVLSGVLLFI